MSVSTMRKQKQPGNKVIYLSQGHFNGRATWHYLLIDKIKLPILLKEAQQHEVDLCRFGNIVFSGFGEQPPEEVTDCVRKKYGNA